MDPRARSDVVRVHTELDAGVAIYSPPMTRSGREAPFVGRVDESLALHALVDGAAAGRGSAVLVVGDAGSGKSRLIGEVIGGTNDTSRRRGASQVAIRIGSAHGFTIERPFGAIHEALDVTPSLDTTRGEPAGTRALLEAGAGSTAEFAVADRLLETLEAECLTTPVVLVIEDLHWADGGTLRFLGLVLDRIATSPLGLVLTSRPPAPATDLHRFLTQTREDELPRITLSPLSTDESIHLASRLVGGAIGPRFTEAIKATKGSPLMIHALAEALDQQLVSTESQVELPAGASLRPSGVLASRIAELDGEAFTLAQAAAVLGSTSSVERLAAVTGRRALDLVPVLDRAEVAGILVPDETGYGFRHELYRTAVLDTIAPSALAAMHVDAARTLIALGASPLDVAEHFALGAQPGDQQAIEWLCDVANSINRRSPGTSLRLAEVAASLATEPSIEITTARVRALAGTGRAADAEVLGASLLRDRELSPHVRAEVHRELALAAVVDGRPGDAVLHVATVAGLTDEPVARARLLAELAFGRFLALDRSGAWAAAMDALREGEALGDLTTQAAVHSLCCFLELLPLETAEALRHARLAVELADHPSCVAAHQYQPWFTAGIVFLETDGFDELDRAVRRGREVAYRTGSAWAVPAYDALASFGALRVGDLGDATAFALAALDSSENADAFGVMVWCHSFLAQIAVARGDVATARVESELAERELSPTRAQLGWDHVMMAKSLIAEAEGDLDAASRSVGEVWETFGAFDMQSGRQWIGPRVVRLALATGDRARAKTVAADIEDAAERTDLRSFRVDAERARGLVDADPERSLKAVGLARMTSRRPLLADALLDAAHVLREVGAPADADEAALEASSIYAAMGADAWAADAAATRSAKATARQRATPARPRFGWEAISQSERLVLELLADGLSNVEIAQRLYLSRRTVESHVSSAYRKLALSTRVELTLAILARRD